MAGAGARRVIEPSGDPVSDQHVRHSTPSAAWRALGAAGLCTLLAACSAHERSQTAAATPAPPQPVALAAVGPNVAPGQGVVAGQPGQIAGAAPGTSVAVAPLLPVNPGVKIAAKPPTANLKVGRAGGGLASWYGDRFHGRPTANGERFNMAGLTAAHRSFPLPSYVRVTNVSNGRSVVVRVNDRGPYHGNRVIDVSQRAADVLGFRGHGVGNVKLDFVGLAPKSGSDDRRLLASYQEFGHPTAAPGMKMASLAPVADSDLAQEASGGGVYALASAAVGVSASAISYSATQVVSTAKATAFGVKNAASSATAAVRNVLPGRPNPQPATQPVAVASAAPAPAAISAYASPQPAIVGAPAAIIDPSAAKTRRVVAPAEPVLASSAPVSSTGSQVDVSSRIAASFEGFGSTSTQVTSGGSVTFEASR